MKQCLRHRCSKVFNYVQGAGILFSDAGTKIIISDDGTVLMFINKELSFNLSVKKQQIKGVILIFRCKLAKIVKTYHPKPNPLKVPESRTFRVRHLDVEHAEARYT